MERERQAATKAAPGAFALAGEIGMTRVRGWIRTNIKGLTPPSAT